MWKGQRVGSDLILAGEFFCSVLFKEPLFYRNVLNNEEIKEIDTLSRKAGAWSTTSMRFVSSPSILTAV